MSRNSMESSCESTRYVARDRGTRSGRTPGRGRRGRRRRVSLFRFLRGLLLGAGTLALGMPVDPHAETVVDWFMGPFGGSNPVEALGPPQGEGLFLGSDTVHTLGVGGSITLELATTATDGAGTDLIVSENPFLILSNPSRGFCEAMTVEVSTNGVHWAAFETRYVGPPVLQAPQDGVEPSWYVNFAGILPVSAGAVLGADPLDVVGAGGDAFDLVELVDHPQVLAGHLSLGEVRYLRITDVRSGQDVDSFGTLVYDAGLGPGATADLDAVTAVNNVLNQDFDRPRLEMVLDDAGFLTIELIDFDGLGDVKAGLTGSVNGLPVDFYTQLLPFFLITEVTPISVTLLTGPIPPGVVQAILKVGVRDHAGKFSGDAVHLH